VAAGAPASAQAGAAAPTAAPLTRGEWRGPSDTPRRQQATAHDARHRLRSCCPGMTRRARVSEAAASRKSGRPEGKTGGAGRRRRSRADLYRAAASGSSRQKQGACGLGWPRAFHCGLSVATRFLLRPSARVPSCRDGRSGMSMETRARSPRPGAGGRGSCGRRAGERASRGRGADRCPPDARRVAGPISHVPPAASVGAWRRT